MKAKMKDNLIERYEKVLPGEIEAQEEGYKTIAFLKSIEDKEIALATSLAMLLKRIWDEIT